MNEYFNNTSNPQPNSSGSSSLIRAEFASIKAGFDKLPTIAGNGGEFVRINVGATALETTGDVVASLTVAATGKTTPVDADLVPLVDSEASNVLKKLTWANLKATLKTYFDSLTTTITNKTIALGSNTVSGTLAQFNTAVTDADLVSIAGTETLTNKTLTSPDINGGTVDGTVIGGTTPAAVSATTLSASGAVTLTAANPYISFVGTAATQNWRLGDGQGAVNGNLVLYDYTSSVKAIEVTKGTGAVTIPETLAVGSANTSYRLSASGTTGDHKLFLRRSNNNANGFALWTDASGVLNAEYRSDSDVAISGPLFSVAYSGAVTIPGSLGVTSGITIGTGTMPYAAGVLGYSDSSNGFVYRPPRVGVVYAHSFNSFAGSLLLTISDAGAVTIPGLLTNTRGILLDGSASLTPGAGQGSIFHSSNYLQLAGGTTGTAFNNHANTVANLTIADAGAVTIPGGITQESVIAPTLLNSWANLGGATAAGYWKDTFGVVHLQGTLSGGTTTAGTALFTLPSGYRPAASVTFSTPSNTSVTSVYVNSAGSVALNIASSTNISLDGISFKV